MPLTDGVRATLDVAVRSMAGRVAGRLVVALRGRRAVVDAVGEGALLVGRATDALEVGDGPGLAGSHHVVSGAGLELGRGSGKRGAGEGGKEDAGELHVERVFFLGSEK